MQSAQGKIKQYFSNTLLLNTSAALQDFIMKINDIKKPVTADALNESAAKAFGQKLSLEKFTNEQLENMRNLLRTKVSQFENASEYNAVLENTEYQKNRMFLDVINKAIAERTLSKEEEGKREKYVKGMKKVKGDFKKRYGERGEEVMYATATKMAKKKDVKEAMQVLHDALNVQIINEGEEDKAELIMAAKDMVDRITGWMEDTAQMQTEAMLELVDAIREEMGSDLAGQFEGVVKPALESTYSALEQTRQQLSQAVGMLTGEEAPAMGDAIPAGGEAEAPAEEPAEAPAPETGGTEPTDRAKRESIEFGRKLSVLLTGNASKKK